MHVRTQLRNAVVALLTGLPTTGANVFVAPVDPTTTDQLPALLVFTSSETSQPVELGEPRICERPLRLEVRALARQTDDLQDTLDQICLEVERALAMPNSLDAAKRTTLLATAIRMDGDFSKPVGQAALVYEVSYYVAENAPDVAL